MVVARHRAGLPVGRTQWLRALIVAALVAAALLAPHALASTGAFYTDSSTTGMDITATPTFPPKTP